MQKKILNRMIQYQGSESKWADPIQFYFQIQLQMTRDLDSGCILDQKQSKTFITKIKDNEIYI